jgi:hypothetical protein
VRHARDERAGQRRGRQLHARGATTVTSNLTVRAPNQQQNQQGGAVQTLATVVQKEQYPIKGKTFYRLFADGTNRHEVDLANTFHQKLIVNDKSPAGSSAFAYKFVRKDVTATTQRRPRTANAVRLLDSLKGHARDAAHALLELLTEREHLTVRCPHHRDPAYRSGQRR